MRLIQSKTLRVVLLLELGNHDRELHNGGRWEPPAPLADVCQARLLRT